MNRQILVFAIGLVFVVVTANLSTAGNIALTGHDDDFHATAGSAAASAQLAALVSFVRNGSSLKVLTFDEGHGGHSGGFELLAALTALGVPFTNVATAAAAATVVFDPTVYSAFIVASDNACGGGGCDNLADMSTALAARSSSIASFLNTGGGILALSGVNNPGYYSFLPNTAAAQAFAPSTGYFQTAAGATYGIPAVNGDATHNRFFEPGTGGTSAAYIVAERLTNGADVNTPETLLCVSCTTAILAVPEPGSILLLGSVLAFVTIQIRKHCRS